MGSKNNKEEKQKKSERNSGQRKQKKSAVEEEPPPSPSVPRPRPRRIVLIGPASPPATVPANTAEEQQVAEALASMAAGKAARTQPEEQDDENKSMDSLELTPPPVYVPKPKKRSQKPKEDDPRSDTSSSNEDEAGDNTSNSDSEELPVSSPAKEARIRRIKPFDITFEVPYKNATRDFEVTSTTSFPNFLTLVADKMETRKSLLTDIAYTISFWPKTPKPTPKRLEDERDWGKLIRSIEEHISTCQKRNRGKGVVKSFSVRITDAPGEQTKQAGKKGKKAAKDVDEPGSEGGPALKEHVFLRGLEEKWWAYLISQHKAIDTILPNELKVTDAAPKQRLAKKALATSSTNDSEPPKWIRDFAPLVGMAFGMARANPVLETPQPSAQMPVAATGSSRQSALFADPPSSGTKRAASETAPSMSEWLLSLDMDSGRGRHNSNFYGCYDTFADNGILDLTDMEDLQSGDIVNMLGCVVGTANRLVKYAKADLFSLLSKSKRARI
ncbi:hypothetical protein R3P38DRAFT_3234491 [Favolaschia claudopus]|uniref:Uncharacterized protein n=1 Tax=Favolaschia claudopus TaxID=2862362 RepID=A0AAV9ZGR2_9AGAR